MTEIEIYKQNCEEEKCFFTSYWNAKADNLAAALHYIRAYLALIGDRKEFEEIHIRILTPTLEIRKDYARQPQGFHSTSSKYSIRR